MITEGISVAVRFGIAGKEILWKQLKIQDRTCAALTYPYENLLVMSFLLKLTSSSLQKNYSSFSLVSALA